MTKTTKPKRTKARKVTSTDTLIRMLSRTAGSPMSELVAELKILPATIRAMISMLRKNRGLRIELDPETKRYRIISD